MPTDGSDPPKGSTNQPEGAVPEGVRGAEGTHPVQLETDQPEPETRSGSEETDDPAVRAGAEAGALAGGDAGADAGAAAGIVAGGVAGIEAGGAAAGDADPGDGTPGVVAGGATGDAPSAAVVGGAAGGAAGALAGAEAGGAAGAGAGAAVGAAAGEAAAKAAGKKLDLGSATDTSPREQVQKSGELMSGLQRAGVDLAKWVLTIIAVALSVVTVLVAMSELLPTSEISEVHKLVSLIHQKSMALPPEHPSLPAVRKDLQELTRQIVDSKQAQRSFWMQFSQMVLLNLLLPVLTAILGYVFGANSNKQ